MIDHHRSDRPLPHLMPTFHLRPPQGFLNDPNGPIEVDGLTHLYFQSRSTLHFSEPVSWGHATSADLVEWRLHRPAMAPVPDGADRDGCWSGNTVLDDGRLRAYYSGFITGSPYQSVLCAVSTDGGVSFGEARLVVPDPAPDEGVIMFRDPFVWREDGRWWLAVGCAYEGDTAAVRLYRSDDLETWQRVPDLLRRRRDTVAGEDTGAGWECPQVLTLNGRRVVVVSSWSPHDGPAQVLSFVVSDRAAAPTRVDHGTNFYAASAQRDSRFGPLLYGWLTEGRDRDGWSDWAGVISLPRRVALVAGTLASTPVPSLASLRSGRPAPADGCSVGAQAEIVVPRGSGRVVLRCGTRERLVVELDETAGTLSLDRSEASRDETAHRSGAVAPDAFDVAAGLPAARIVVDGSVVEVFTSGGRVVSSRIYPTTPPPWRIEAPRGAQAWVLGEPPPT